PFASTFAAFMTRAFDFIRMAAISRANLHLCGSHAGVSIGEDGPSQMALEDLAMMRAVHGSTVLYPCDANQTARLVGLMAEREGIGYLRTTREKTPILYTDRLEEFRVGGSRVVRGGEADDAVAVIAAGITVHEAIKAADEVRGSIKERVIDAYSVKPIDTPALVDAVRATGGRLCVVEDHWVEGGLGDAVLAALAEAGADRIHVDVMDGHYVPNITIGPVVVRSLRRVPRLPLEAHLMIAEPGRYLEAFADAGADRLTVHVEGAGHLHRTLESIAKLDRRVGLALNPATSAVVLDEVLPELDLVLVMTVDPGFGGQDFIPGAIPKIRRIRALLDRVRPECELE